MIIGCLILSQKAHGRGVGEVLPTYSRDDVLLACWMVPKSELADQYHGGWDGMLSEKNEVSLSSSKQRG